MINSYLSICRAPRFLAGTLGLLLAFLVLLAPAQAALAAEPTAAAPAAGKRFATVWRIRGEVTASRPKAADKRRLREGDAVFVGERINAAPLAEAVLKTDDAGLVAVRPGAEFVAERFVAEGKSTDGFVMRILSGSLRVITGWIGQSNREGNKVATPTATIGIRGTDHEPYVLSAEMAAKTGDKAGTYDKVNRGGTQIEVGKHKLDVDAGRVGFARAAPPAKTRAMIALLMPVLLEKVPGFYVPGRFDTELDEYSRTADETNKKLLEEKRKTAAATPAMECKPTEIAKSWLETLDGAIARGDAATVLGLFAPDVTVRATVRADNGAMTTLDLQREELVESTLAAIKELKEYKQRRISLEAKDADPDSGGGCPNIAVKSVVIEQGLQSGKPFRFESLEEYVLVLREGKWLALKAETTQR